MWKIGVTTIELIQGDITNCKVDAIVNAANTRLLLGSGVAGAIRKKGGGRIQEECSKIGQIELGQAALTTGGNLPAKYVIHAASMQLGGQTSPKSLFNSILHSLTKGAQYDIRTIAFPAIGTGIAGFSVRKCAEIMVEVFNLFLQSESHIYQKIQVVLFTEKDFLEFQEVFEKNFSEYQ